MRLADGARARATLADLIFGDAARRDAALETIGACDGWSGIMALAAGWRVVGPLRVRLEAAERVPDSANRHMRTLAAASTAHAAACVHHAAQTSARLEAGGVPTLAIKGVAAIADLYGALTSRWVSDFDCIVSEDHARFADRLLTSDGLRCTNDPFDLHVRRIETSPRHYNYARTYVRDGFEVDLHWRLGRRPPVALATATLFGRSSYADIRRARFRVPHPVDAQLLAVHHAMRGGFSPSTTLKDLCDLTAWWTLRGDAWNLDELIDTAIASGLAGSLCALWTFAAVRDPRHPVAHGAERLRARLGRDERRAGARLWRLLEAQLLHGDYAPRTFELFAPGRLAVRAVDEIGRRTGDGRPHAPLPKRVGGFAKRTVRIARELLDVRQLGGYAEVARAQRRYR